MAACRVLFYHDDCPPQLLPAFDAGADDLLKSLIERVRDLFRDAFRRLHLQCLIEFTREHIEKYISLLFWRDDHGESKELMESDHQLKQFLEANETHKCSVFVESDVPTYLKAEFKDEIYWGVRLAAAVYSADELRRDGSVDVLGEFPGTIIRSNDYLENKSSLRFLLAFQKDIKRLYVAVRGTVDMNNWLTNFSVTSSNFAEGSVGLVHSGFLDMANLLKIEVLLENLTNGDLNQIVICGHSLGGAVATLLTARLLAASQRNLTNRQLLCVTIGAPPAGESNFCLQMQPDLEHNITSSNFIHLVHEGDIVPRVMNLVDAVSRYMTIGAIRKNDDNMKYRHMESSSRVFEECLTAYGSAAPKQGYTKLKIRAFDKPSRVLRRVAKVDYGSTSHLSTPNLLAHIIMQRVVPLYEQIGCVLLFNTGVKAFPVVHNGDPRVNEEFSLQFLSESCMVQYHNADGYVDSMQAFLNLSDIGGENALPNGNRKEELKELSRMMKEINDLEPPRKVRVMETATARATRELCIQLLPDPSASQLSASDVAKLTKNINCIVDALLSETAVPGRSFKNCAVFFSAVSCIHYLHCQGRLPPNMFLVEGQANTLARLLAGLKRLSKANALRLSPYIKTLIEISPYEVGQEMYQFFQTLTAPTQSLLPWRKTDVFSRHLNEDDEGGGDSDVPETKRGYMYKQGRIHKNWLKRFFILEAGYLTYYEEGCEDHVGKNQRGHSLRLAGYVVDRTNTVPVTSIWRSGSRSDQNLTLTPPEGKKLRALKLDFDGCEADADVWEEALGLHINYWNSVLKSDPSIHQLQNENAGLSSNPIQTSSFAIELNTNTCSEQTV